MSICILAFLIGAVTGLRTLAPAAVISWAAHLGWLNLQGTWLAFLRAAVTPYILSILALGELITDKLPRTPSRKIPMQFGARIVMGALSGAALAASDGVWIGGPPAARFSSFRGSRDKGCQKGIKRGVREILTYTHGDPPLTKRSEIVLSVNA